MDLQSQVLPAGKTCFKHQGEYYLVDVRVLQGSEGGRVLLPNQTLLQLKRHRVLGHGVNARRAIIEEMQPVLAAEVDGAFPAELWQ